MIALVKYEELVNLLQDNIDAWMQVGGGPNFNAFEFDPNTVDLSVLDSQGYYKNREAWIAGVQVKKLQEYLKELTDNPIQAAQNK